MTQSPGPGDPPVDLTAGTTSTGSSTTTTTQLPAVTASGSAAGATGSHDTRATTDVAKEQGRHVKESAVGAAADVAGTAKEQASEVAGEARRQAKDLLHEGRSQLQDQAAQQQRRAAAGLRSLGDELRSMAQHSSQQGSQQGVAADLAHQAADRAGSLAAWLEEREPGALLDEVRGFARQRPMAFLALAAGAGVVAGRLGRGLQADAQSDSRPSGTSAGAPAPTNSTSAYPESTYPEPTYPEPTYPASTSGAMATDAGPLGVVPPAVPTSGGAGSPTGTNRPYDTGGGA